MNKDLILGRDRGNMYRERGQTGLCDVARLFKTFVEKILRDVKSTNEGKIGGKNLNKIKYAADIIVMTGIEQDSHQSVNAFDTVISRKGLKINARRW